MAKNMFIICASVLVLSCSEGSKMVDLNKYVDAIAFYKNDKIDYKIGFLKDGRFFYQIIQNDSVHNIKTVIKEYLE